MPYTYIHLGPTDLERFRQLNAMFGKAFNDLPAYEGNPPEDAYLLGLLQKSHIIVVVAEDESGVVGGLVAYEMEKFEQKRSEIYIYDLAVDEDHRRRGIATQLINELKTIGKARGAYVLLVQADPGDEPAIKLYEKMGTREEVYHFDILIS